MRVRFVGPIRLPDPSIVEQVQNSFAGGTVSQLLGDLGFAPSQAALVSVLRDGRRLPPFASVEAEDSLIISLLVGGG